MSESGIHRPHVAGIHGRENEGAYSIVLSGGYDEDIDDGEEFTYSGSGGRDLSGNKRTAKQSMDQKLTHMNKLTLVYLYILVCNYAINSFRALARNCDAPVGDKKGASAKSWKNGNPVRVVGVFKLYEINDAVMCNTLCTWSSIIIIILCATINLS